MQIHFKWKKVKYNNLEIFKEDSIQWANNPIYGWCNKNKKLDGTPYSIYTDGLKIHTTINSRMQNMAEEAIKDHLGNYLQDLFFAEKKGRRYAPFDLEKEQIDQIMGYAILYSVRGTRLRRAGVSTDSI